MTGMVSLWAPTRPRAARKTERTVVEYILESGECVDCCIERGGVVEGEIYDDAAISFIYLDANAGLLRTTTYQWNCFWDVPEQYGG